MTSGSSGRSGAPGGRGGSQPSRAPQGQPPSAAPGQGNPANPANPAKPVTPANPTGGALPELDYNTLPPMERLGSKSHGGSGASAPRDEQISGPAAAQLFSAPARPTGRPTSVRISAAPGVAPGASLAATPRARLTAPVAALTGGPAPEIEGMERMEPAPRAQTLTQQLRAVQPPDVARQAINELSVLAGELVALARELELSGLARIHEAAYFDAVSAYGELARRAWLSVAAERLEQDGASPDYRQRVVGLARDITRLRRESELAASNEQFPLPQRRPYLWRRRAGVITRALGEWQGALSAPADPQRMGQALFELRGALNSARTPALPTTLLRFVTLVALWLTPLSGLAAGMVTVANILTQRPLVAASFALVTLLAFMLWAILLLLTGRGRITLGETLAGACYSETRSGCNGQTGSRFVAGLLRAWWLLIGGVGALLTLAVFVGSGFALYRLGLVAPLAHGLPQSQPALLTLGGGLLGAMAAPAALAATATLVALALPALLVSALRFAGEMGAARRWAPGARRYGLVPAVATLSYLTGALVALAWLLAGRMGLAQHALMTVIYATGAPPLIVSERAPLVALALALPYLALIELPFRLGLRAWRRVWLHDLRSRRATIEAHVRRLSAPDPRTGAPDTSDETLRAMQYDLILLQFYAARIEEAERASASPLGLGATLAVLLIVVAGALLLDAGAHSLAQALLIRLTP